MTDPFGTTGAGAVQTYLTGTPAVAYLEVDVKLHAQPAPPDDVTYPKLSVHAASFDTEDYLVLGGLPSTRPELEVRMRSRAGLGEWIYSDAPPAPFDIDNHATMRWLPTVDSFAPDGSYWLPTIGDGLQLDANVAPYLDENYSFETRNGDEVDFPAVIFSGDAAMALSSAGWAAPAFSFVLVAVVHRNPEGPRYGLIESQQNNATDAVDWGLRYNQGRVGFFAGSQIASHMLNSAVGRPVFFAISLDAHTGQMLICDRSKSSAAFSTDGFALYDIAVLLGQTSAGNPNETAWMDVLDFSYFDRALSTAELAEQLHLMDSIYGIVT